MVWADGRQQNDRQTNIPTDRPVVKQAGGPTNDRQTETGRRKDEDRQTAGRKIDELADGRQTNWQTVDRQIDRPTSRKIDYRVIFRKCNQLSAHIKELISRRSIPVFVCRAVANCCLSYSVRAETKSELDDKVRISLSILHKSITRFLNLPFAPVLKHCSGSDSSE